MATDKPELTITEKAEAAFYLASLDVIERARQTGTPIIVWEDGRVVEYAWNEVKLGPPPPGAQAGGRTKGTVSGGGTRSQ